MLPTYNSYKPVLRHTRPAFTIEDELSDWRQRYKTALIDIKYGFSPQSDINYVNRFGYRFSYRMYLRLDNKLSMHKKTFKSSDKILCEIKHEKPYQLTKLCNCKFRRATAIIKSMERI